MLSKLRTLFWLGIFMLIVPFLGIPNSWKMVLAIALGLGLVALAIMMRSDYRRLRNKLKEYGQ